MDHSPADIIAQMLTDGGAFDENFKCFVNYLPDAPKNCAACFDTTGSTDGRRMRTGKVIVHPGVQLRFRHTAQNTAYKRASLAADIIDAVARQIVVLDTVRYHIQAITRTGLPIMMGQDPNRLWNYSLNANCTITNLNDDSGWPQGPDRPYTPLGHSG